MCQHCFVTCICEIVTSTFPFVVVVIEREMMMTCSFYLMPICVNFCLECNFYSVSSFSLLSIVSCPIPSDDEHAKVSKVISLFGILMLDPTMGTVKSNEENPCMMAAIRLLTGEICIWRVYVFFSSTLHRFARWMVNVNVVVLWEIRNTNCSCLAFWMCVCVCLCEMTSMSDGWTRVVLFVIIVIVVVFLGVTVMLTPAIR